MEFLQNCMNDISKQIAITEQTIKNIDIKIEVWDRNCDVDEMNCKHIRVTFYTYEGTCKTYSFESKILLSDFNLPSQTALMGNMLIKQIREEEMKYYDKLKKTYLWFIGIFMFSLAVSYYIEEGVKILFSTIMLGILITILLIIIEQLCRIKRSVRKKNRNADFITTINAEGKELK